MCMNEIAENANIIVSILLIGNISRYCNEILMQDKPAIDVSA